MKLQFPFRKGKVYISGPISHRSEDESWKAFFEAEIRLVGEGYDIINPRRRGVAKDQKIALKESFKELLTCTSVVVLEGWRRSDGSAKEVAIAYWSDIPVYDFSTREEIDVLQEMYDQLEDGRLFYSQYNAPKP